MSTRLTVPSGTGATCGVGGSTVNGVARLVPRSVSAVSVPGPRAAVAGTRVTNEVGVTSSGGESVAPKNAFRLSGGKNPVPVTVMSAPRGAAGGWMPVTDTGGGASVAKTARKVSASARPFRSLSAGLISIS